MHARGARLDLFRPLGHGMMLAGFLLPWVIGEFGARERLSGLDLARLANGLSEAGLGDSPVLTVVDLTLLAIPLALVNALLFLALARVRLVAPRTARTVAGIAAAFTLVVAGLVIALIAGASGATVRGPGIGLVLALVGAVFALVPPVLGMRDRAARAIRSRAHPSRLTG